MLIDKTDSWVTGISLKVVVAVQLAMLGLVGLATLGFDIPVLRHLVGFIYLTFIPGILILRSLRLHRLGGIEALLYSVGLSFAFAMFLGFFMNMLYPLFGISKPISILPIITTWTVVLGVLCFLAYRRDKDFIKPSLIDIRNVISPPALFLCLIPLLAIFGTHLMNFHQSNILLLILIGLIAVVVALVTFNRFIPQKLYPMAVVMIAISLLWHWSLISQYLVAGDIHTEYYFQNLVLADSFWNHTLPHAYNTVLSVNMLAPIYSLMLDMDSIWLFKIVYPLFFCLVPLTLFQVFRKQTDDKIAFLAAFFFMSLFTFYSDMLGLARQQIAELFFALSILLLLDKEMAAPKRAALLIIFGLSVTVSHYGLSYFYMFYLLLALFLLFLAKSNVLGNLWARLSARSSKGRDDSAIAAPVSEAGQAMPSINTISVTFVALIVVFALTWFIYTASATSLAEAVRIGDRIYHSLAEFTVMQTRDITILQAIGLTPMHGGEVEWQIARVVQYVTQLFIVVGVIGLIINRRETRFHPEYTAMSLVSMVLIAMCIILPYFAGALNMARIYHITLFFLAPLCVLGGIATFRWLFRLVPASSVRAFSKPVYLNLVVMLTLIPYFLFQTGFIFEVRDVTPTSQALNSEIDSQRFNEQEVSGKVWLSSNTAATAEVFADWFGRQLLSENIYPYQVEPFWGETVKISDDAYIYLRSWNVKKGEVWQSEGDWYTYVKLRSSPFYREVLVHRSKIYDNGGARVYR